MLAGLLLVCMLAGIRALAQAPDSCQSVYFKVTLNAHDDYQRELGGGLLFRVTSQKDPAWFVDIVPAEENTKDYIYPVNLPLQLNGNQTLGPGYGETVKSSLSHPHEMNFLLDRSDYQRISGLVSNVLHSYQTSDPDRALSDYSNAVDDARKGWLRVRIASYNCSQGRRIDPHQAAGGDHDSGGLPVRSGSVPLAHALPSVGKIGMTRVR